MELLQYKVIVRSASRVKYIFQFQVIGKNFYFITLNHWWIFFRIIGKTSKYTFLYSIEETKLQPHFRCCNIPHSLWSQLSKFVLFHLASIRLFYGILLSLLEYVRLKKNAGYISYFFVSHTFAAAMRNRLNIPSCTQAISFLWNRDPSRQKKISTCTWQSFQTRSKGRK